ncbi:MAG: hypothetical protein ACRCTE_01305 [Cellulosilyticaceae bacterium]
MPLIHPAILGGLGICILLLVWIIWEEKVTRMIIRGISGILLIAVGNLIVPASMVLEWNVLHIAMALLLGIPGGILMFFVHYIRG